MELLRSGPTQVPLWEGLDRVGVVTGWIPERAGLVHTLTASTLAWCRYPGRST